jgi:hypothetical protein
MAWPPPAMSRPACLGGEHRRAEIDPGDRSARALADPVLAQGDDDRRAAEFLLETAGDDPDHARMPARRRDQDDGAIALGRAKLLGRLADQGLDRSPLLIVELELGGDPARFLDILGGQQPDLRDRTCRPGRRH